MILRVRVKMISKVSWVCPVVERCKFPRASTGHNLGPENLVNSYRMVNTRAAKRVLSTPYKLKRSFPDSFYNIRSQTNLQSIGLQLTTAFLKPLHKLTDG